MIPAQRRQKPAGTEIGAHVIRVIDGMVRYPVLGAYGNVGAFFVLQPGVPEPRTEEPSAQIAGKFRAVKHAAGNEAQGVRPEHASQPERAAPAVPEHYLGAEQFRYKEKFTALVPGADGGGQIQIAVLHQHGRKPGIEIPRIPDAVFHVAAESVVQGDGLVQHYPHVNRLQGRSRQQAAGQRGQYRPQRPHTLPAQFHRITPCSRKTRTRPVMNSSQSPETRISGSVRSWMTRWYTISR